MIKSKHKLSEQELNDLKQLRARCKKEMGSTPNFYMHILSQPRVLPASLLYYKKGRLLGFLAAYFFYERAVEISILVDIQHRRKGIARELITKILPLLEVYQYSVLIFSSPSHLNDHWLPKLGCTYMHSEYHMQRSDINPILEHSHSLVLRTATMEDLPVLNALDEACFSKKEHEAPEHFHTLIDDRNYHLVLAFLDNQPVGKAHMRWNPKGAMLSDIAILPELQGKGLGTEVIAYCINYSLSEGKSIISLDVETHNERALNLYKRLGFAIQNACDYWKIAIKQLKQ